MAKRVTGANIGSWLSIRASSVAQSCGLRTTTIKTSEKRTAIIVARIILAVLRCFGFHHRAIADYLLKCKSEDHSGLQSRSYPLVESLAVSGVTGSLCGRLNWTNSRYPPIGRSSILMRIMYTRVKREFRPFSFDISALFHSSTLQTVENHRFLRGVEEGGSANLIDSKGLTNLHIVDFE